MFFNIKISTEFIFPVNYEENDMWHDKSKKKIFLSCVGLFQTSAASLSLSFRNIELKL